MPLSNNIVDSLCIEVYFPGIEEELPICSFSCAIHINGYVVLKKPLLILQPEIDVWRRISVELMNSFSEVKEHLCQLTHHYQTSIEALHYK